MRHKAAGFRLKMLENALSLSRNLLAKYMGLGSDSVDVAFSMDNQLPENPSSLFEVPENALARTSEYHLLQQNLKASRLQKDITMLLWVADTTMRT